VPFMPLMVSAKTPREAPRIKRGRVMAGRYGT